MKLRVVIMLFVLCLTAGFKWQTSLAQIQGESEEFCHTLSGEFRSFYYRFPNHLELFGYPLTDAFLDPKTNLLVQYFQKVRFEYIPDQVEGKRIRLSPLGKFMYIQSQTVPLPNYTTTCRYFPNTGAYLCPSFLDFFDKNGGVEVFGEPISNVELYNGRRVQYFERVRLEFYPEYSHGKRVVVSSLGSQYFYSHGENLSRTLCSTNDNTIQSIIGLKVRAYPGLAVTPRHGMQSVHVIVQDQRLQPVKGALVTLIVRMPSGEESRYILPEPTNEQGVAHFDFPFSSLKIGLAELQVTALVDNLQAWTLTSFRIWW